MPTFSLRLVGAVLVALSCGRGDRAGDESTSTALPALSDLDVNLELSRNYAFWQITLVMGDQPGFASNLADNATMYAPGYGKLVGRASILAAFGGEGKRLGITEVRRVSQGYRIEGREVADSGVYEILTARPLPPSTIDANGRYWTRWRFTEAGRWLILSDSLAGNPR